jgi:DNA-binding transcriptional regulator GbsR (MarR family)
VRTQGATLRFPIFRFSNFSGFPPPFVPLATFVFKTPKVLSDRFSTLPHSPVSQSSFLVHFSLNSPPKPIPLHRFFNPMLSGRPASASSSTITGNGDFEQECATFLADVVQLFGIPKSVGQIYGVLYASPVPLGFSDIVERLEISKGSASQGLQLLRSLGAINEVEANGKGSENQRGVRYEPELSLRQLVSGVLRERVMPLATTGADRLKNLRQLAEQAPESADFYLDRVKQLETWRRRLNTVLPVLSALLGPKKKKAKK